MKLFFPFALDVFAMQRRRTLEELLAVVVLISLGSLCLAKNPCSDGPPVLKNPAECCAMPALIEPAIMMDCFQKWGEQTKRQSKMEGTPRGCCVAECATNATNLLANGKLNRKATRSTFLASSKDDPRWQSIVKDALEECFAEADRNKKEIEAGAKLKPSYDGEKICHPISGTILRCMTMKTFNRCPVEIFQSNAECDLLKKYHAKCPLN